MNELDLSSKRAYKARLQKKIGKNGFALLWISAGVLLAIALGCFLIDQKRLGCVALSLGLLAVMLTLWYKRDLLIIAPEGTDLNGRISGEVLARLKPKQSLTPRSLYDALATHWQSNFLSNHLLLPADAISGVIPEDDNLMPQIWAKAIELSDANQLIKIEPGFIIGAIMMTAPDMSALMTAMRMQDRDIRSICDWLGRILQDFAREKQSFGGVGRDWAFGFTPLLNQFGQNLSLSIARTGVHFGSIINGAGVNAIESAFANNASAVALIGPDGIGKTSQVYALAQHLIEGKTVSSLAYHQIISLDASAVISAARRPGELEQIMTQLANEAAHAGHVVLFLDDAQLFFGGGPGAFDATQILLPIVQAHAMPMILAMTPNDYQRLRTQNSTFAGLLTPVVLAEPAEAELLPILEDAASRIEGRHRVLISYTAIIEAYRLSGRYEQDTAYPGKAVKLLEQAVAHANGKIVGIEAVHRAIEQTRGVRVGNAAPAEASQLLNLEDRIHERMINQVRAVKVVASALRRARAGVADPRRPIGSFLFLGPTGVGKTELAKAVAATYFGAETNMIRLDMSEYQQPEDVQRLLSNGVNETKSLILSIRQQPFTVVLLDEIEKAHPNILNLLLQLLDEGQLTDSAGRIASFKDSIIIATSNAGANSIRERIAQGQQLENFEEEITNELINSGQFKPELLNRFDDIVLFRPLNQSELAQVVQLMIGDINKTLSSQNISVELTDDAVARVVAVGYDPRLGARPMRRALQRAVEDGMAGRILRGEAHAGDHITLDVSDLSL